MITLVISDNEGTTTRVPLVLDEVSIGRKEGNTIRLTERNISRSHCKIARIEADYLVQDLGSYNGVIVNGQRIERELKIQPGDEIRIGDYTVALEAEVKTDVPAAPPPPPPARQSLPPAKPPPSPVPRAPARLVVLTPPLAGAEFSLPEQGVVRVGRANDLEVAIDHRSVSREHAVVTVEAGRVRIADQGSANGLVVNRDKVSDAVLAAGDLLELGDVVLRFCGAGEKYMFDPVEARALVASRRPRARWHMWAAGAIVGAALIGALVIVRSPGEGPHATLAPEAAPSVVQAPAVAAAVAPAVPPTPAPSEADTKVPELVQACHSAVDGGRFAEGMAHASAALKLRADSADAQACQALARSRHEQEQIYVRASAALESGDVEGAWSELLGLDDTAPVAQRPEVAKQVETVAGRVLDRAAQLARKDLVQAAALARSVVERPSLPAALRHRAQTLLAKVDRPTTTASAERVAASTKPPRGESPAHEPRATPPRTRPAAASSAPPMETATGCLARGDNQCVIRALAGRAQTAQELGLLIETYRAVGESALAYRSMATYVQRFPTARKADQYRALLGRQGQ